MADKDNRDKLYEYADIVRKAKLDCMAKALLWHYAYTYNWTKKNDSFYAQRKICSEVGFAQETYYKKRNYLEKLGWIRVQRRGFDKPCLIKPTIGIDDPDYENRSWAKWHSSNEQRAWEALEGNDPLAS